MREPIFRFNHIEDAMRSDEPRNLSQQSSKACSVVSPFLVVVLYLAAMLIITVDNANRIWISHLMFLLGSLFGNGYAVISLYNCLHSALAPMQYCLRHLLD